MLPKKLIIYAIIVLLLMIAVFLSLPKRYPEKPPPPVTVAPIAQSTAEATSQGQGQVAIVIDDIGFSKELAERLMKLSNRLTLAIIPSTPFAGEIAGIAHSRGHELLIHLPMQPLAEEKGEPEALTIDMNSALIGKRLSEARAVIPQAIGLNNHMGSRFTANRQAVERFMQELEPTKLFLLDSRTTGNSLLAEIAQSRHLPCISRDIFLDNIIEPEAIRKELRALFKIAKTKGKAVGIGHPYPETIASLEALFRNEPSTIEQLKPLSQLLGTN